LVGEIGARINPATADYQDLWGRQFAAREAEIAALAVEPGYYALYGCSGEPGVADFVAGMSVKPPDPVPAGLTLRLVPAGRYASFPCAMATISVTWGRVDEWFETSGHVREVARPDLEYYAPNASGPDAPVTILVPVAGSPC